MSSWRDNPIVAIIAAVLILACALFWLWPDSNRPRPPHITYVCENDHRWDQRRSLEAICPECKSEGLTPQHITCRKCQHSFEGWTIKQVGVGEFRYRSAGQPEWTRQLKPITCPGCKRKGVPDEGGLYRLGGSNDVQVAADPEMD